MIARYRIRPCLHVLVQRWNARWRLEAREDLRIPMFIPTLRDQPAWQRLLVASEHVRVPGRIRVLFPRPLPPPPWRRR